MSLASKNKVTNEISLDVLVDAIGKIDLRNHDASKLNEVIDLIEYLREQAIDMHAQNTIASKQLDERIASLTRREAELQIKTRAVESIIKSNPVSNNRSILKSILGR